ncbi:MAG: Rap1a/Tai family immunity protein [Bdellovibrionales bacterium]
MIKPIRHCEERQRRSNPWRCFWIASLALAMTITGLAPAQAARFTGQYFLYMCGSDENGKELALGGHIACQAYISGILDYHTTMQSMGGTTSVDFCVPDDEDLNAIQGKLQSYVFKNRKQHNAFIAAPAVMLGLHHYYDCKK